MGSPFLNPNDENDPLLNWGASLSGGQQLNAPDIPQLSPASMQPAAPPAPAAPPQNDYGAMEALAGLGPPPKSDGTANNIAMALAMLADAALDKGRAIGPIMGAWASRKDPALETYQLGMDDAMKRAQIAHLMGQAHGDPEATANRKRALDLEEQRLNLGRDTLEVRKGGVPGIKDALAQLGMDPAVLEGMTDAQATALKGAITSKLRQGDSNAAWTDRYGPGGIREQTTIAAEGRKPAVAAATAAASKSAEIGANAGIRGEDQAAAFGKENDKALELAHYLKQAEDTIAANPSDLPGVGQLDSMKMNNEAPLVGAGKEGIDFRKNLANIRDLLARERSGATFSGKEKEDLYRMAAGLDSSSEAEIKSAIQGMHGSVQSMLRARSTGREGPANAVMKNAGVSDWMGGQGADQAPGEPPAGKVLVQEPSQNGQPGRVGYIPADRLAEALRRGARRIQ
jgi:hypothetical protein